MLDIFNDDMFTTHELTAAIDNAPYQPSWLGSQKLFKESSVSTTAVFIEKRGKKLYLVPETNRGSNQGFQNQAAVRTGRTFRVPHLATFDTLLADDLLGVRDFGSEDGRATVASELANRLETMKSSLETTMEYHRVGAVVGLVLDASGSTLFNLFTEFGIVAAGGNIDFGPTEDIETPITTAIRSMMDSMGNHPWTGAVALCGDAFFDNMLKHPTFKLAFERYQEGQMLRDDHTYSMFHYKGVDWVNYRGSVGAAEFIADAKAHLYPKTKGMNDLFMHRNGPPDDISMMGKRAKGRIHVTRELLAHGAGVNLKAQANPLIICTSPEVLYTLTDVT
jgi:hypothetical protein